MAKATTEQIQSSKDNKILKGLSMEVVYDFLQQDDNGKRRAIVLLENQYEDAIDSDSKTSHLSRQYLLDRGFGKALQAVDVTTKGDKITAGIFVDKDIL